MKIFSEELVAKAVHELHVADLAQATIGEVLLVAQYLEQATGIPFIRMDQGSPGLPAKRLTVVLARIILQRRVCRSLNTRRHALLRHSLISIYQLGRVYQLWEVWQAHSARL